jgi:hypothetical protein
MATFAYEAGLRLGMSKSAGDNLDLHYGKRVPWLSAAEMDYVRRLESILHD